MPPHRVGFLCSFGRKTGIHFGHFGLESGMVFEGTTGLYECLYRFDSKWVTKKETYDKIGNGFEEFFCLRSNLSNDNIISAWWLGLKMGMDFRGLVWKRVWKITFLGLKLGQHLENWAAHSQQEFPGVVPPPLRGGGAFPVQASIQLPCFLSNIQYWQRSCEHFFDMLILFCGEDYGSVSWNSPIGDYQIFDWRVNILIQMERSVRRHSDYSKRPPVHAGGFSLLPPQSPCCFSVLTRLYYVACPTKIVMPRR